MWSSTEISKLLQNLLPRLFRLLLGRPIEQWNYSQRREAESAAAAAGARSESLEKARSEEQRIRQAVLQVVEQQATDLWRAVTDEDLNKGGGGI